MRTGILFFVVRFSPLKIRRTHIPPVVIVFVTIILAYHICIVFSPVSFLFYECTRITCELLDDNKSSPCGIPRTSILYFTCRRYASIHRRLPYVFVFSSIFPMDSVVLFNDDNIAVIITPTAAVGHWVDILRGKNKKLENSRGTKKTD